MAVPPPQQQQQAAPEAKGRRQIPIVCPGHTRPLAELQFRKVREGGEGGDEVERTLLVSACHDKQPMVRDGITGDWIGTFSGHKGAVWSCRLDPQGYLAGTASGDFSVRVWDAITGKSLYTFGHKHIVKTLEFSGDSKSLATGGHEGLLRVFDLMKCPPPPSGSGNAKQQQGGGGGNDRDGVVDGGPPILSLVQRPDKKITISKLTWLNETTVLAAGSDGMIRFWDVSSDTGGKLLHTLKVQEGSEVRDMELSAIVGGGGGGGTTTSTTRPILTVAAGTKVFFYDLSRWNEEGGGTRLLKCHPMPIHFRDEGGASLHPTGKKFIAGGSDLWVRVFDYESGEELECLKGHHGPVRCLRYAPDGKTYATGSEDGTIRLWKTDPQ